MNMGSDGTTPGPEKARTRSGVKPSAELRSKPDPTGGVAFIAPPARLKES